MYAEHGTAGYDIVPSVRLERLERRRNVWELLYLIEEKKRLAGNEMERRIQCGHPLDDTVHLVAICGNLLELRLEYEIDLNDVPIMLLGKMPNRLGLADLTGAFDEKRLAIWIRLPQLKPLVKLSIQIPHFFS